MHIMAPKNKWELSDMMKFAYDFKGPIAIRYPRGEAYDGLADKRADVEMGKSEMLFEEEKIALFAVGSMVKTAVEVREALKEKGISCTVVNARFVKPIDENMVRYLAKNHDLIVPMEGKMWRVAVCLQKGNYARGAGKSCRSRYCRLRFRTNM